MTFSIESNPRDEDLKNLFMPSLLDPSFDLVKPCFVSKNDLLIYPPIFRSIPAGVSPNAHTNSIQVCFWFNNQV